MADQLVLRFFFDGGGCLWSGCERSWLRFGPGPLDAADHDLGGNQIAPPALVLSHDIRVRIEDALALLDGRFNPDDPAVPLDWTLTEALRFRHLVDDLLAALRTELGAGYVILDQEPR